MLIAEFLCSDSRDVSERRSRTENDPSLYYSLSMRLGIDLGTTRTLVAMVDRGNYPVVTFENPDGDFQEWFPSLLAIRGAERCYGFDAVLRMSEPDWTIHRSFKRHLGS